MATKKTTKKATKPASMIGREVIIRSGQAGVFHGTLIAQDGDRVTLRDCTRLWRWYVAKMTGQLSSLSELAVYGAKRDANARYSVRTAVHVVGQVIEIIPLTREAAAAFRAAL